MTLVGQQLGHYWLVRLIGQGGMGEAYLAEDTRISRQIAIKVVRNEHQPYPNTEVLQQQALDYTDLHAQLMISREEALQGGSRTITLLGKDQITATIPSNAQHGQMLYLPEQGTPYYHGGPLLLTPGVNQNSGTEAGDELYPTIVLYQDARLWVISQP